MGECVRLFVLGSQGNLKEKLVAKLKEQEEFIEANPLAASELLHQFLGFHLGILDFGIKQGLDFPMAKSSQSVCPLEIDLSSLKEDEINDLKAASLHALLVLIKTVKKSRIFAFWYVFLPKCTFNPAKRGIFELITYPCLAVREKALELISVTFQSSSNHLQLANAHCKPGSFTPVCLEFAQALARMIRCATNCLHDALRDGLPSHVSHASRALVTLFEQVPFHKLENGLIADIFAQLYPADTKLSSTSNPVILIGILQVFGVLESISPPHKEVAQRFNEMFEWFNNLAFPPRVQVIDNNVRYVAISNLSLLAVLDTPKFFEKYPLLQPSLEDAIRNDTDQSILIHCLRLLKTVGKSGNSVSTNTEGEKRLLHFWLSVLKPSLLDSVEERHCPVLKAALCNCIAEVGGGIFCHLPTDRRMLALTFMLRLCRDSDHRTVTAATRGLGMLVSLPSLQNDTAFLTDCAEIMIEIAQYSVTKPCHQSVITSCTWALANLSDSLAKHHLQGEDNTDDIFPPYLVLQLIRMSIKSSFAACTNSHMTIRSNSVRSLGSLLQCLDGMSKFICIEEYPEVSDLCREAVHAIAKNISCGKVMKVRWNACYAASLLLKVKDELICSKQSRLDIIQAILPVIQSCPNYKVRINGALALMSIDQRSVFSTLYCSTVKSVVNSMESAVSNLEDSDEIQHRSDLIDQLCSTYAHLLCLIELEDFRHLANELAENVDMLTDAFKSALLRISPEKTGVFVEAQRRIQSLEKGHEKVPNSIFPSTIVDTLMM